MPYAINNSDLNFVNYKDDKSPVDEFLQNTSITIVSNVKRRHGILPKAIWLVLASISFCIAGYQSYGLINDYLECKIKQISEFNPQNFPPLPSFTVCDGIPVNWTYLQSINHSIYKEASKYSNYENDNIKNAIILGLLRLPEHERQMVYDQSEPFQPEALFSNNMHIDSPISNITFRNIVWGQCVTYNEALNKNPIKMIGICSIYGVNIKVPMKLEGRIPNYFLKTPFILIHPRGSPPDLSMDRMTELFPYDKITVRVEQTYVKVEADKKCLSCVDNEKGLKMENIYDDQSNNRTYGYTFSGCIMSQAQKILLTQNNCVDIIAPVNKLGNKLLANTTLCTGSEVINFDKCDQLCEYLEVYPSFSRWSKLIDHSISQQLYKNTNISEILNPIHNQIPWRNSKEYPSDAIITIHQAKGYSTVRKMAMYSIWDLLGIIGGNVSLWLGISMLSVWEVIELGCIVARKKLKKHFKTSKTDKTKVIPLKGEVTHIFQFKQYNGVITMPTVHG